MTFSHQRFGIIVETTCQPPIRVSQATSATTSSESHQNESGPSVGHTETGPERQLMATVPYAGGWGVMDMKEIHEVPSHIIDWQYAIITPLLTTCCYPGSHPNLFKNTYPHFESCW